MIALIDNYDSFSYNLFQLIGSFSSDIRVIRNDGITVDALSSLAPEAIILSPGPGRPEDAGICVEAVRVLGKDVPMLGVCLGHQAICKAYGAEVSFAKRLMHGKQSEIRIEPSCPLFSGLPETIKAARYHSLAAVGETLPEGLHVTARADDGEIMAVRHKAFPVYGLQFHPESILTPDGGKIIHNFLKECAR